MKKMTGDEILSTAGFQTAVANWCQECFGPTITNDQIERSDRLLEEILELLQTVPGFTQERAHKLVDYVFNRPVGQPLQEMGGVMVCLAAFANAMPTSITIGMCANAELTRVMQPEVMLKVRDKQAMKRLIF